MSEPVSKKMIQGVEEKNQSIEAIKPAVEQILPFWLGFGPGGAVSSS